MADAIAYRGPDDWGVWSDQDSGIALAHRRLSILDCSPAGHQPMVSSSGRYVMIYNGEVYNHGEIARELDNASIQRQGHSDTEVILEAFAHLGADRILPRLAGMFAFALWDRTERQLTLARDPLGIKPLYWGVAPDGTFLFGSELKALRAHPSFNFPISAGAASAYFQYGYVPTPGSIFQGIYKLPPGSVLHFGIDRNPRVDTYWSLENVARQGLQNPLDLSDREAIDALEDLLITVTSQHLMSDVPVGAFLSGGIDSSTVVALMARAGKVRTFTIGYQDQGFDESADAADVAAYLKTDHNGLTIGPEQAQGVIPLLSSLYDEPFADSSAIPTYLVSKLARQQVTVALSGDGGDEMFAGYNRHIYGERIFDRAARLPRRLRKGGAAALTMLSADSWDSIIGRLPFAPRLVGNKIHKLAAALKADDSSDFYESLVSFWPKGTVHAPEHRTGRPFLPVPGMVESFQYLDMSSYLPDDILTKVDRASMGVSLESRVPLLDRRVAEFAWRLPRHLRLRDGQGKWLLRQVLHRHLPSHLVDRPKMGFAIPFGAWLRGPLRDWAEDLLSEPSLKATDLISPAPVRKCWSEHLRGKGSWDHHLWVALMFVEWHRRWM